MTTNIVNDLSNLTNVPALTLEKLLNMCVYCIASDVTDIVSSNDNELYIDLIFGKLKITLVDNSEIKYKFIPSKELESQVVDTLFSKEKPLTKVLEQSLVDKIMRTYKDIV